MFVLWLTLLCSAAYTDAVNKSEIFLYYYNQTGGPNEILYNISLNQDISSWFNGTKNTVFYVHGWYNTSNVAAARNESFYVRNAVLNSYDVHVFALDYPNYDLYTTVVAKQPIIGKYFGEYLNYLASNCSMSLPNTVVIGHSLGAHISGVAGETTGSSLGRITALDPAGPLYIPILNNNLLKLTDAQYVEAIHTNAGEFGIAITCGDSDFWVNGGSYQPNCIDLTDIFCSHRMSYIYFADSVTYPKNYLSHQCAIPGPTAGSCLSVNSVTAYMGGLYTNTSATGSYYLDASAP